MTEWLKLDGTIIADAPHGWPPQGAHWSREAPSTMWIPLPGRVPPCGQIPEGEAFGCDLRQCRGCILTGGPPSAAASKVGPWTPDEWVAAVEAERRAKA